MFAKIKQVAVVGAVVAGVGWVTVVSPAVAPAQPLLTAAGNQVICPGGDVPELQYVRDPHNPNAYYECAGGVPQRRLRCPPGFYLELRVTPPGCGRPKLSAP
jgi:hypothetical protein